MRIWALVAAVWTLQLSAFAQQESPVVRINRTNCESAKGSPRASEALKALRALTSGLPGLDDAISACDTKVQNLKKQEDDSWARAVQAKNGGQCALAKQMFQQLFDQQSSYQKQAGDELPRLNCGTSSTPGEPNANMNVGACTDATVNLRNARGSINNKRFDQAKTYATAALSCPAATDEAKKMLEEIDRGEKASQLAQRVTASLVKRDNRQACELISQIDPSYPDLNDLKRRAGDCTQYVAEKKEEKKDEARPSPPAPAPPPVAPLPDPLLADYKRAVGLAKSRPAEAERILQKIRAADRNYKDVDQLLKEVRDDLQNKDFAELEKQARNSLDNGDLQTALDKIERAITVRPNESRLLDFKNLVVERMAEEGTELSAGINAYYSGKYAEAAQLLGAFLNNPHSVRVLAFANFYAGAATASEYYLGGQADASKKEQASKAFSAAMKQDRQFSPDWTIIKVSPKIRSLFLEASGRSGK
jgi:tetratricopeptide (TPR) repeat protein